MSNGTKGKERFYWTREVANMIGIKEGTVRKYARLLEENGYQFHRNEHDQREFLEHDVTIMEQIKVISKEQGMTLENAIKAVIGKNQDQDQDQDQDQVQDQNQSQNLQPSSSPVKENPVPKIYEELSQHKEHHERMFELIQVLYNDNQNLKKELAQALNKHHQTIAKQLEACEERIMGSLTKWQESNLEAAASLAQKQNKRFFKKILGN
ncbi:DNA-binding transcriptional MerR regulator [Scopulibacillus daqui]|uniref:DNA-binding transcriptional MerR regulator n=1 Tax=Scopulibacillus daqui TaxID=1469162 RepID=A0ABS2PZV8_9BACL|nr:MerR family transcriptional regulator [Scopulibacillus daqui]MBM7645411.1 DNA-binding transcriptional MerR regulator [Scopulibacillus daqui]